MNPSLEKAIEVFKNGGVVIFPTDTVFGIGCRIDNKKAIKRIFEIKKRKEKVPLPILISSVEMAQKYVEPFNKNVIEELINKYWPGGLTIVTKVKKDKVLEIVRSNKDTVAVRMPDDKNLLEIIEKISVPIIGTSANFHGKPSSSKLEDLDQKLLEKVDFVLPGVCKGSLSSTIIDVTRKEWKIIREGVIKINL